MNHFYKVKSAGQVAAILATNVESRLSESRVLLLLSGGSCVEIAKRLPDLLKGVNLSDLTVSLADERFGRPGHADSNWRQLTNSGFRMPGANLQPFLNGRGIGRTAADLEDFFNGILNEPDVYKLALLGMGADGHTAGILPGSPAVGSDRLIVHFAAADYQRLTLGFSALDKLDEALLYATGENKMDQLQKLEADTPLELQPAQIIKRLPRWTVYNDRIGEEI